jgi:hypothetical protein
MANADSSRPVTVKSARSAPLSIETAASCAETVATNTQKSSVLLLLRPAALAVLPRGIPLGPLGPDRSDATRRRRGFLETAPYADAPFPDDRTARRPCAWFRPMPVPRLEHPSRA